VKKSYDSIVYRSFISALSIGLCAYSAAAYFAYRDLAARQPYGPPPWHAGTTSLPPSFAFAVAAPVGIGTLVIAFILMFVLYSIVSASRPEVLERLGARGAVARISAYSGKDAIAEQRKIAAGLREKYADEWKFYSPLKRFLLDLRIRLEAARIYRSRLYSH